MRKTFLVISVLAVIVITAFSFTTSDPIYKNLKVLPKDITKPELDSVMHHFSMSLGVKCTFCHVRNNEERKWDFASDSIDRKDIARKMMRMASSLNKDYFNSEEDKKVIQTVTCYTCHHGQEHPTSKPPMPVQLPPGQAPQQPGQPQQLPVPPAK